MNKKYIDLTSDNFDEVISKGISIVDFWAPWCGPCRMIGPVIEELAEYFDGKVNVCKVNVDDEKELASKFSVRSIPYVLFLKDGEVFDSIIGATGISVFKEKVEPLL